MVAAYVDADTLPDKREDKDSTQWPVFFAFH